MVLLQAFVAFAVAALANWVSDRGYGIHWLIGFSLQLIAVLFGFYVLAALILALFQLVVILLMICVMTGRALLGKRID